jgi:hypothetical protein
MWTEQPATERLAEEIREFVVGEKGVAVAKKFTKHL